MSTMALLYNSTVEFPIPLWNFWFQKFPGETVISLAGHVDSPVKRCDSPVKSCWMVDSPVDWNSHLDFPRWWTSGLADRLALGCVNLADRARRSSWGGDTLESINGWATDPRESIGSSQLGRSGAPCLESTWLGLPWLKPTWPSYFWMHFGDSNCRIRFSSISNHFQDADHLSCVHVYAQELTSVNIYIHTYICIYLFFSIKLNTYPENTVFKQPTAPIQKCVFRSFAGERQSLPVTGIVCQWTA